MQAIQPLGRGHSTRADRSGGTEAPLEFAAVTGAIARDVASLWRLTRDFRGFLAAPIGEEQAIRILERRLADRERRFLEVAERTIYDHPASPYLKLLRSAGCELGDLNASVAEVGVEATLERLAEVGAYVTFDEFKGRDEAVRGSSRFRFTEADFDNPLVSPHFETQSGGTRSHGTSVRTGLPFVADQAVSTAVALHVNDLSKHDHAYWLLSTALTLLLRIAKLGRRPVAWFYPLENLGIRLKVGSRYVAALGRAAGCPLPVPKLVPLDEPERVARWLSARGASSRTCLSADASSAVRISIAAQEQDLPLDGVCFVAFGEPFTEAKRRMIEGSGARAVVHYGLTEAGLVGYSCAEPEEADDVHVFSDVCEVIEHERPVGTSGLAVDSFLLTSLLPSAPKVLFNVEPGDHGVLERRRCGCRFDALGLTKHVSRIQSFEKLTGEGVTFAKADLLRVLEQALPARFGGAGSDYQVLETEDGDGLPRLILRVSPDIGPLDEGRLRQAFLDELARDGGYAPLGAETWRRAETLEVERRPPIPTTAGKILPFHALPGPRPGAPR
jgi:hypothetical protein